MYLFIGDSLMRYFFLSLILILRNTQFDFQNCHKNCPWFKQTYDENGNMTYSESWAYYYKETSSKLLNMTCNCCRTGRNFHQMIENRCAFVDGEPFVYFLSLVILDNTEQLTTSISIFSSPDAIAYSRNLPLFAE